MSVHISRVVSGLINHEIVAGQSGSVTAHYAVQQLPGALRSALTKLIDEQLQGRVDRVSLIDNADVISTMLQAEIRKLDDSIGLAVRELCDDPARLTREQAIRLIDEHEETIECAFQGTTVALALINVNHHLLWAAGLGNSTVGEHSAIQYDEGGYSHEVYSTLRTTCRSRIDTRSTQAVRIAYTDSSGRVVTYIFISSVRRGHRQCRAHTGIAAECD